MSELLYEHGPDVTYLSHLVTQVIQGELLLPRFRRDFVWTGEQRLALFDSVAEGLPFGSILVWRTSKVLSCYNAIGHVALASPSTGGVRGYLLDGLQRLSTFVTALSETTLEGAPGRAAEVEEAWDIAYDLERSEFVFLSNVERERRAMCLPMTEVLSTKKYFTFQRRLGSQLFSLGLSEGDVTRLIERADEVTSAIRSVKVPVVYLATDDLLMASAAFQRLNMHGTPLSEVHMVSALSYSEHFDLLSRIEELMPRLSKLGWGELDPRTILQTCQVMSGLSIAWNDPALISQELRKRPEAVDEALDALERAVVFLRDACGVGGPRLLSSDALLVCLASVLNEVPSVANEIGQRRKLVAWFWLSIYSRTHFSGSGSIDHLMAFVHKLARDAEGAKWWGWAADKADNLPKTMMRLNSSRGATFVAQLCRLKPKTSNGLPVREPHVLVARQGAEVLAPLLDAKTMKRLGLKKAEKLTMAANRVLIEPADLDDLRNSLLDLPPEVLQSHAITPEAIEALRHKDAEEFLRLREQHLVALEQAFLDETRRTLVKYL